MIQTLSGAQALYASLGLFVGALLGLFHFVSLRVIVRLYVEGGAARAVAIKILRFGLLIAILAALAKVAVAALVGGAFGLLAARGFVLRRLGSAP
ncbi:ATP synthase subunit I [Mesorhizobium sp. BAC0120]|uniref:N-ATPase subunit AtpR n=1 Tax=Mesorhizobium sp. BAC0120 TaxID=3090670 RepID=UPI00298C621E|nr:ATP synthase subunit I [Mesorhizobium sp. BAC0120]MDW6024404.1 ATP synthase subunit I [Mesorhizobium sp. BAC0120]